MKKKIFIPILLIFAILLTSCSNIILLKKDAIKEGNTLLNTGITGLKENDSKNIKEAFGKDTELSNIKEYLIPTFPIKIEEEKDLSDRSEKVYKKIFENIDFKIESAEKKKGIWHLNINFDSKDMGNIMVDSLKDTYEEILNNEKLTKEGFKKSEVYLIYMDKILEKIGKDEEKIRINEDILLIKEGDSYIIRADQNLINGLFGGLIDKMDEFNKEIEEINSNFKNSLEKLLDNEEKDSEKEND